MLFDLAVTGSFYQATQPVSGTVSVSNFPATQPVSGTVAATQSGTWNIGTLTSITNPVAVTGTFFQATQPVSLASLPPLATGSNVIGSISNTSFIATQATAASLNATVVGTGTFLVQATQSGTWNINNVSGTISLPTGASTSALQTTGNSSLSSIDSKTPALGQALAAASVPVVLTAAQLTTLTPLSTVAVTQSTSPWVVSGTVTANAGTNLNTSLLALESGGNLASINTKIPSNLTVTSTRLLVDGSGVTQPVSGTFFQATQPVSIATMPTTPVKPDGTVWALTGTSANVSVTNTVPISGTIAATQSGTWTVQPGNTANTTAWKVDGSAVTQPVSGTVTVNPLTNSSIVKAQLQDNAGTAIILGQTTMSASLPVTIASNQTILSDRKSVV